MCRPSRDAKTSSPDCPESVEHARVTKDPSPGGRERASGRYMIFAGAILESVPYAMHMISPETRGHGNVGLVVMAQPSTPLPIKQAISLVPEVVGRSVLARWIGLCLEGFGCQENAFVRTFGSESRVRNLGCCGSTCHFCTCALE